MNTGPGTDAWLQPPEPRTRHGRRARQSITINISRAEPCCGEPCDPDSMHDYEVLCEMDEGSVYSAVIVSRVAPVGSLRNYTDVPVAPPVAVDLRRDETECAEVAYSDDLIAREESAREDAADARSDR